MLKVVCVGRVPCVCLLVNLVALAVWSPSSRAAEANGLQDKSRYWLFNPTPENLLRELTTDRPDMTESPFTVDAGHVQLETHIFGHLRSQPDHDGTITKFYELGETDIRIGLTNRMEFNLLVAPYGIVHTRRSDAVMATRVSGSGGIDLRMKINLWGNDTFEKSGATALGLLPFVTLPTDRDNGISPSGIEGGFILPFAVKLTDKWSLGTNAGFNIVRNDDKPGTHTEWVTSASLCYEWTDAFNTYYEAAGRFGTRDPRGEIGLMGMGFIYKLRRDLQLDGGVNFGITKAADRINPFIGISARF